MKLRSFDSFEEAMKAIKEGVDELDHRVAEWQRAIQPGDTLARFNEYGIVVLYHVEAFDEENADLADTNWLMVRGYSAVVPRGDLGTVHRAQVHFKISKECFAYWLTKLQEEARRSR